MERWVLQQEFPNWDSLRIMNSRGDHLEWMHRHFASTVIAGSNCWPRSRPRMGRLTAVPRSSHPELTELLEGVKNEIQLRDAGGLPAGRVPVLDQKADELGFYVCRGRDVAQGPLAPLRGGGRADQPDPDGTERVGRRAARADADRPGSRHAGRADRRSGGGRGVERQLRAARRVQHRLGGDEAAVASQGSGPRDPTLLDEGTITHDGEFFKYSGLFTFARPVQERLPVKMGAMRGPSRSKRPRSSPTAATMRSATPARPTINAATTRSSRTRRDVQDPRSRRLVVFSVAEDGDVAKDAARSMVGLYASSMPHEQLKRNGVDPRNWRRSSRPSGPATWPRASS